jgi:hypothetical protein
MPSSPFFSGAQKFVLVILILLASAAGGLWWYAKHLPVSPQEVSASEFSWENGGAVAWFSLSGSTLTALSGPSKAPSIPGVAIREASSETSGGTYPVLVLRDTEDGSDTQTVFGIFDSAGAFLPIDTEGGFKAGLTAKGNILAYAAFIPHPGTPAAGPAAFSSLYATSTGSWEIRMVDLNATTSSPVSLGQGSDPRFLADGSVLAFGNEGAVRIDPNDLSRTVIVPHAPGIIGSYAASPDLSRIAVSNLFGDGATTIYAISPDGREASAIGVITARLYPIAFASNDELVGMSVASSTPEAYLVSDSGVAAKGTLTVINPSSTTP